MAFTSVELAPDIYHLQSGANSGLIVNGDQAVVIDAGLDDDAGKKIRRTLESMNLKLSALILTHGHADHFGGAAYLRRAVAPFSVYAPAIEAAFIENPAIEGIFLSAGALPFDALMGKFTLAQACEVDQIVVPGPLQLAGVELQILDMAGHSPGQIAVQVGAVLFSADAFLPIETLRKYPVPFTVHMGRALAVLDRLLALTGITFAPGHGVHLTDAGETIRENMAALQRVIVSTERALHVQPMDEAAVTQYVCKALGDPLATPVGYYLARSAIQAALVYLYEQKRAHPHSIAGRLVWTPD